jgi:Exostosin family
MMRVGVMSSPSPSPRRQRGRGGVGVLRMMVPLAILARLFFQSNETAMLSLDSHVWWTSAVVDVDDDVVIVAQDERDALPPHHGGENQQDSSSSSWLSAVIHHSSTITSTSTDTRPSDPTFYLVAPPEYTTNLVVASWNGTDQEEVSRKYYRTNLNEESAEVWLHRGFANHKRRIRQDPKDATIIVIAGYFHLKWGIQSQEHKKKNKEENNAYLATLSETYTRHLNELYTIDPDIKHRPHLLLIPTWNPVVSKQIGVKSLVKTVMTNASNVWSVGFERNPFWQEVPVERIIPIPYVVTLEHSHNNNNNESSPQQPSIKRQSNFVFYAGDSRPNAKLWAGCHRERLIVPLQNETTIADVRIVGNKKTPSKRLNQVEYNHRMQTSEYCFILCGDTPTSRSLTSAMVSGCIPIFIGSRWRGLCEPPCRKGWGWKPTGSGDYPHWPYRHVIPWETFPELDEQRFMEHGKDELLKLFEHFNEDDRKNQLRSIMNSTRTGWIYGWGDPLTSDRFGDAVEYIWQSFLSSLDTTSTTGISSPLPRTRIAQPT